MNTFQIIIPVLLAFLLSAIAGPVVIRILQRKKIGQTIRKEGLESHQKKAGKPMMGGFIFLFGLLVTSLFFLSESKEMLFILIVTFAFGCIGFMDDFLKARKKSSTGLLAWQKMALQFLVTGSFATYLYIQDQLFVIIPFTDGKTADLGVFSLILLILAVLGTVNGSNFTDGVDALCGSVTAVIAVFFIVASILVQSGITPIASAMFGALLGYLIYNFYPAKIIMGDTGSLALGGFVVACAYVLHMPLFIPLFAIIYLAEVISVILQVGYFKLTHGKRIFKMAPLHHHYEKSGWSETKVVGVFTVITILMSLIAIYAM